MRTTSEMRGGIDRQPLIHRVGDGVESMRIEAGELRIAELDLARPLQRADQRDRAQARAFDIGRKPERSVDRRPRAGGSRLATSAPVKRNLDVRFQAIGGGAERQLTGKASAGDGAGHVVECDSSLPKRKRGAEFARGQQRRQAGAARLERDPAVIIAE